MMMDVTAHLVRHGEVENPDRVVYASLPGFGLSQRGRAQAQAAAERLQGRDLGMIVTSPLERAVETAGVVAATLELRTETDDRLVEWELGERWAGTAWEDLDTRFPGELGAYLDHPEHLDFAPESLGDLAIRMGAAAEAGALLHTGHSEIVLVSHQDPIQAGRLALTGRPLAGLQSNKPGHCSIVTLAKQSGTDLWTEVDYWEPDQATVFPPLSTQAD